jgi:4-amino-4-deoxy-L-arabinose transferase-like glycosyltransferase
MAWSQIFVLVLVLLGAVLRLTVMTRAPLHQDEALYGYWGRLISSGRDTWLRSVPLDKPPVVPYLIAGSQRAFGVHKFATRLPGFAASLISIPLAFALGLRLYRSHGVGLVAAAVMALTPFPILFGATAFTDPLLVLWWLGGLWAVAGGGWGGAGMMWGLAFASKQQALLLAPLVLGMGLVLRRDGDQRWWTGLARFSLGALAVVGGLMVWNLIRVVDSGVFGFWRQSVESFGGLRLIWSSELTQRWQGWAQLSGYIFAWPWLGGAGALLITGLLGIDGLSRLRTHHAAADLMLGTFVVFYLLTHLFVAFPVWDRYLLPVVPLLGLLLGRVVVRVSATARRPRTAPPAGRVWRGMVGLASKSDNGFHTRFLGSVSFLAMMVVLLTTGLVAVQEHIPVGGDHGAYDGLDTVVDFLHDLPVGTVLYDRWLTWHYDYYLFDAPLFRAGFPSVAWLAADAAAFYDGRPRYLVVPDWESVARLVRALKGVELDLRPVMTTHRRDGSRSFVVYAVERLGGGGS